MKRQIRASEQLEVRVITLGVDIVIPADMDASEVEIALEDDFNAQHKNMRVAAVDFKEDVTEAYENNYPAELFI